MTANAPDDISKTVQEHHTLAILRLLNGDDLRGAANDHLLTSLFPLLGFKISHVAMRSLIDRLERIGAVCVTRNDMLLGSRPSTWCNFGGGPGSSSGGLCGDV